MKKNKFGNPFSGLRDFFPVSYSNAEIDVIPLGEESENPNRFYIKSKLHQTNKFIPLPFYKLISLGVEIQSNIDM